MPSTASKIDIYNMALDLLEEQPSTSFTDGQDTTNWLNRNYETTRDAELRKHPWNFALKRASLPADTAAPAFGWAVAYTVPSDCLAVQPLTVSGKQNTAPIPYEFEGDKVLTDATAPLLLRYTKRITNEGKFDPLFVEALTGKLAAKMAHWLTGKSSFSDRATQSYEEALSFARLSNALESTYPRAYADDVITIRSI